MSDRYRLAVVTQYGTSGPLDNDGRHRRLFTERGDQVAVELATPVAPSAFAFSLARGGPTSRFISASYRDS